MSRTYRAKPWGVEDWYRRPAEWKLTADGRAANWWCRGVPKWCTQMVTRIHRSNENQRIRAGEWDFPSEQLRHRHSASWWYW
jgi:hypothetical protein